MTLVTTYIPKAEIFEETLMGLLYSGKSIEAVREEIWEVESNRTKCETVARMPGFTLPFVSYIPAYGADAKVNAMNAYCGLRKLANENPHFATWFAWQVAARTEDWGHTFLVSRREHRSYRELPNEEYMNPRQHDHFRRILTDWYEDLATELAQLTASTRLQKAMLDSESDNAPIRNAKAPNESPNADAGAVAAVNRDERFRRLMDKISQAMVRIDGGTYGYCAETGKPIGVDRLEQYPVATYCPEVEERMRSQRNC